MIRLRQLPGLFVLLTIAAVPRLLDASTRSLTVDLYLDMEDVGAAQISPDGKRIVYARRWVDKINDRRESSLRIMNADGSDDRPLTKGSAPRWSPDSTRIAYVGQADAGGRQLFVKHLDGDDPPLQITHVARTPGNAAWSADGKSLAFTMLVPKNSQEWQIGLPGRAPDAKWAAEPRVLERLVSRRESAGFLEDGFVHIFVVPAEGGEARQLTQGDRDFGGGPDFTGALSWTPDGRQIVFSTLNTDDWEYPWRRSDVHAIDVRSRSVRRLTSRAGPDYNPVVSPDGRWVAYSGYDWSNDSYIQSRLHVVGIDGSNPRVITQQLDRSLYPDPYASPARSYWWAADSSGLYFNVGEHGTTNLYFASRAGDVRQITRGNHVLQISDIDSHGTAVGTRSSYYRPNDIVIVDVHEPSIRQLTFVNDDVLQDVRTGEVEEIWYRSTDELQVQGWIVKPPDFDPSKKYPLILSIHGGPHASYRVGFDFALQNHAAEGYVVLYTNPRGSTGYGEAFGNAINNAFPGKDYDDLMRGVDAVIARGYIDERNLFVYGCSGGGTLTAWIVGHTNRFAAASANCAVTNQLSFVGMTDGASFYWNYKRMFWEDPSEHLARSPIMYVGNVQTPTLLMTGELDLNTPIAQAEDFYRALKLRGIPTALVRFPDEGHGTYGARPSNFLRTQLYLRHWFGKYRK